MVLPTWDPNEPRFIVTECPMCSDERSFKNNKCVFNQRLGFAYSVDEIVEVLNDNGDYEQEVKGTLTKRIDELKRGKKIFLKQSKEDHALIEALYNGKIRELERILRKV